MASRRHFLVAAVLGAIDIPFAAAQSRTPRIGIMSALPLAKSIYGGAFVRGLADAGYRDGTSAILEYRSSDGFPDRYPRQARELVDLKCDIIFTLGSDLPVRALIDLGTPVPTVFWAGDYDPIEKGIIKSLRRPEGNITGLYAPQGALVAKRLELLKETLPGARRFLLLTDVWSKGHVAAARKAAEVTRVHLTVVEFAKQPYDFTAAFATARQAGVEGIVLLNSPVFSANIDQLSDLMAKHRLASVGPGLRGILLSYYTDLQKSAARVAAMGEQILKGARPSDIPVEQYGEFQFVVNLKIAKALGVKVPQSVMVRATRVIE